MRNIIIIAILFLCLNSNAQNIKIEHTSYTIIFDTVKKSPVYTYYMLYGNNLAKPKCKRTTFSIDPLINSKYQRTKPFYDDDTLHDKGHLSPDDDFRFDFISEKEAMYYTNCAPQNYHLNRGVWRQIEEYTRTCAEMEDSVKVYTGVIYQNTNAIPSYYWKAIIHYNKKPIDYFLAKNETYDTENIFDLRVTKEIMSKLVKLKNIIKN